jgi:hypothetical protein
MPRKKSLRQKNIYLNCFLGSIVKLVEIVVGSVATSRQCLTEERYLRSVLSSRPNLDDIVNSHPLH